MKLNKQHRIEKRIKNEDIRGERYTQKRLRILYTRQWFTVNVRREREGERGRDGGVLVVFGE